jgi:hypothetical protein
MATLGDVAVTTADESLYWFRRLGPVRSGSLAVSSSRSGDADSASARPPPSLLASDRPRLGARLLTTGPAPGPVATSGPGHLKARVKATGHDPHGLWAARWCLSWGRLPGGRVGHCDSGTHAGRGQPETVLAQ